MPIPALVSYVAFYIVTSALSYALTRKAIARAPKPEAPAAGQLEAPDARETGQVPVVFGTVWINPNVCWYGDLRVAEIQRCTDSGKAK